MESASLNLDGLARRSQLLNLEPTCSPRFLLEGLPGSVAEAAKDTAARLLQDMVDQGEIPADAIQIQDLHIHLTAEVVQQLNMNPAEVKNYFAQQIKEATFQALKKP